MKDSPIIRFADCHFDFFPDGSVHVRNSGRVGASPRRLTDRLEHWAALRPDRAFLARRVDSGWREVTYASALDAVRRIGQALLDRDLAPSRPVMILSGNSIEHALLSLACLHVGVPYVPVSTAYSLLSSDFARLRDIVRSVSPGLVFADDGPSYEAAIRACIAADVEVVVLHGGVGRPATPYSELLAAVPTAAVQAAAAAVGPNSVAKLLFTSGSTGDPKGVISTQGTICSMLHAISICYPVLDEEPPVLVDWMPWNHVFGGTISFGLALYNGGTLFIDDGKPVPASIETTVRNLREVAPTIYSSVPKAFEELLPWLRKDAVLRERFFSRVRFFQCSGASISPAVCREFDQLAIDTIGKPIPWAVVLGSTEAGPMLAGLHTSGLPAGYVGLPVPGATLKLTPVDGKLEARIRSPYVTPGYWRRQDLSRASFDEEGFYRTGDAVTWIDEQNPGRGLRYDGRIAEDFKVRTGTWIRVGLLRDQLLKQLAPEIRDVVVAGENRNYVAVLAIPATPGMAEDEAFRTRLLAKLADLSARATGSSNRVLRLTFLTKALSIDAGELTEKGAISQRGILRTHASLIEDLYSDLPSDQVLSVHALPAPAPENGPTLDVFSP
jgi:feruloyl-CoA synthase